MTCYFSQWDGDHVGRGDCVPTSLKMLLCLYSVDPIPSIAEVRTRCDIDDDGVINLGQDAGITLDAARAAAADYGLIGSCVSARDVPFEDILDHVRQDRPCMVFIMYGFISNRVDKTFAGLHAVVLLDVDDALGRVSVLDPDRDFGGAHPDQRGLVSYSIDELLSAWDGGGLLGGGAFIPDYAIGGLSVDDIKELIQTLHATADAIAIYLGRFQRGLDVVQGTATISYGKDPAPEVVEMRQKGGG